MITIEGYFNKLVPMDVMWNPPIISTHMCRGHWLSRCGKLLMTSYQGGGSLLCSCPKAERLHTRLDIKCKSPNRSQRCILEFEKVTRASSALLELSRSPVARFSVNFQPAILLVAPATTIPSSSLHWGASASIKACNVRWHPEHSTAINTWIPAVFLFRLSWTAVSQPSQEITAFLRRLLSQTPDDSPQGIHLAGKLSRVYMCVLVQLRVNGAFALLNML